MIEATVNPQVARPSTLNEILDLHAGATPYAPALTFEGKTHTYADLKRRSLSVANALDRDGFSKGARVGYLGKNTDDFVLLLLGSAYAGVVVVPLNPRLSSREIGEILGDAGAQMLLVSEEYADTGAELYDTLPTLRRFLVSDGGAGDRSFGGWASSEDGPDKPRPNPPADAVVLQLYTSGTTGRPKGVMLTHNSLVRQRGASERAGAWWDCIADGGVVLLALTVSHVGGMQILVRGLYARGHTVILREFEPGEVLDAIHRYHVARLTVVPSTLQLLIEHPKAEHTDFSSLDIVQYGASPIPLKLLIQSIALMRCKFVQVYGMTEAGGSATALPPFDHHPEGAPRMRSVGIPLPGVEVKVASTDGRPLLVGEVGEILLRTPAIMKGYWNLTDETRTALDDDGWYRTGDAGYLDDDGYIYLCDRIKDMICSGAENIYPAEVENVLRDYPGVADVAVIGVPDENWGEAVKAIIVPSHPGSVSEAELLAFARERIARFKVPKSIDFIDALPRNTLGKVQRRELRKPYWASLDRQIN